MKKHGMYKTRIYRCWTSIRKRCLSPTCEAYAGYGGRGIKVCPEWESFEQFCKDMGDMPPGMSIERIDVNGDYEPGNCKWATMKEQARNRRNGAMVTAFGETLCMGEWCERYSIDWGTLRGRLDRGWDAESALTTPSNRIVLMLNGKQTTIPELARQHGIKEGTIRYRLASGRTVEEAIAPRQPHT